MAYFVAPVAGRISSDYGYRIHPITRERGAHRGFDIAAPIGTPVRAVYGGVVRGTRTDSWHGDKRRNPYTGTWNTGNFALVDGPGGGSEWYGHLHKVMVKPGDIVRAGDVIGTVGQTGNVTGPHLHLELWNGRHQGGGVGLGNTRDPKIDYRKYGVVPGREGTGGASPAKPKPAKKPKHVIGANALRARLKGMGIPRPALLSQWVKRYQDRQRYAPGLGRDSVWGPANEAHYQWTRGLQRTMRGWKGSRDTAIDGDLYRATVNRVREIQTRNKRSASNPRGKYTGKIDGIPGPVFCAMLKIAPHPGA